jgi:hypothetical protein
MDPHKIRIVVNRNLVQKQIFRPDFLPDWTGKLVNSRLKTKQTLFAVLKSPTELFYVDKMDDFFKARACAENSVSNSVPQFDEFSLGTAFCCLFLFTTSVYFYFFQTFSLMIIFRIRFWNVWRKCNCKFK